MKSDKSYYELKKITDDYFSGRVIKWSPRVLELLKKYNVKLRQDDGSLQQVNISFPSSRQKSIVLGLRYRKNDDTQTEDHFLFQKGKSLEKHYKGSLEKIFPEYQDTHKMQVNLS